MATASVAQFVERWSTDPGSRFNSPLEALELHFRNWLRLEMYIFPGTWIYHILKHLSVDNECNCQILSLIYTYGSRFVSFDLISVIKFGLFEKYLLDIRKLRNHIIFIRYCSMIIVKSGVVWSGVHKFVTVLLDLDYTSALLHVN